MTITPAAKGQDVENASGWVRQSRLQRENASWLRAHCQASLSNFVAQAAIGSVIVVRLADDAACIKSQMDVRDRSGLSHGLLRIENRYAGTSDQAISAA